MDSRNALRSTGEVFSHSRFSSAEISVLGVIRGGCAGAATDWGMGKGAGTGRSCFTGGGARRVVQPVRVTISAAMPDRRSPENALLMRLQLSWLAVNCPP
jgi:hypothetical protein